MNYLSLEELMIMVAISGNYQISLRVGEKYLEFLLIAAKHWELTVIIDPAINTSGEEYSVHLSWAIPVTSVYNNFGQLLFNLAEKSSSNGIA